MYYPIGWPKRLKFRFKDPDPRDSQDDQELPNGTSSSLNGHHEDDNPSNSSDIPSKPCNINDRTLQVTANSDRSLFVVLTCKSIHIWFSKPSVEIVSHCRTRSSLNQLGQNHTAHWKPDSTMIVVKTTMDVLIFFNVAFKEGRVECVFQQNDNIPLLKRESAELMVPEKIPGLYIFMSFSTKVTPGISCILAAEEEVVVATKGGELIGINWDGSLDPNFRWEVSDGTDEGFVITDMKYSSLIGGFSLVFSNGKLAFMPIHYNPDINAPGTTNSGQSNPSNPPNTSSGDNSRSSPSSTSNQKKITQRRSSLPNVSSRVQFVPDVDNGVTSCINHKYQLITYGLLNSEGLICIVDDENTIVVVTHRIKLPINSFPESSISSMGSMSCMQWSPDSMVLATSWERGGIALWSVFGALLMCSLSWDYGINQALESSKLFIVSSIAWSREGYQLWLIAQSGQEASTNGHPHKSEDALMQMSMAKSVLASNPSSVCSCRESLLLVSEDKVYLGVGSSSSQTENGINGSSEITKPRSGMIEEETLPSTNSSSSRMEFQQQPVEVGNHQWIVIQIPFSYLSSNSPIRLACIDQSGSCVAIAGRTGFAHYSLLHRKWKLFGNESQEKDFEVCGGILYYESHIIMSCYNIAETAFEIRAYPRESRLDNHFMKVMNIPTEVLAMSIYGEKMITLSIDGSISLFGLNHRMRYSQSSRRESSGSTASSSSTFSQSNAINSFTLIHLNQIIVSNLVIPPECVISIFLTSLHIEEQPLQTIPSNRDHHLHKSDSILVNVCGRVFLLERESEVNQMEGLVSLGLNNPLSYRAVSILASGVENVWVSQDKGSQDSSLKQRPHLTDALWLSRGCHGMNVWLPLFKKSEEDKTDHNFMSKRIMLPINTHIYPLAVLFRDAVVIGAENDTIFWGKSCPVKLPYSTISRTSQVYLHPILRELIKKNLGRHAWDIAKSCSTLPHFPHSLELLLHETLEEEATSSQPIPDPLLPRVVNFIREFQEVFLETIAHCARKTELALWPHLFDSVQGNPRDLFQACLDRGLLDTAASYLLVLQTLDRPASRRYASSLLEAAEKGNRRKLVNDLKRFLESIHPEDFESPPTNKPGHSTSSSHPPLGSNSLVMINSHVKYHALTGASSFDHHLKEGSLVGRKRTASSSAALMLHPTTGVLSPGPQSPPILHQVVNSSQSNEQYVPSPGRSFSLATRKLSTEFSRSKTETRFQTPLEERESSSPEKPTHGTPMTKVSRSISEPLRRNSKGSVASDDAFAEEEEANSHSLNHFINSREEKTENIIIPHQNDSYSSSKLPGKPVSLTSNGVIGKSHPLQTSGFPNDPSGKSMSCESSFSNQSFKPPINSHMTGMQHLIQVNSRKIQDSDAVSIHSTSSASNNCTLS